MSLQTEAFYTCENCGEEIVVPIDHSEGHDQLYTEDCPVCCCPNEIHVCIDRRGEIDLVSHRE